MKVLVTGGAGFIGSAVIRMMVNDERFEVVNLDLLTYAGGLSSLLGVVDEPNYHFEKVDICDIASVKIVLSKYKPEAVVHLAAETHEIYIYKKPFDIH